MDFKFFRPSKDLSDFVLYYWTANITDVLQTQESVLISPSGMPELIFHFGQSVSINFPNSGISQIPTLFVAGQLSRPITVSLGNFLHCLCIKLKPYALGALFNTDSSLFTNRATDLGDISLSHYHIIQNRLSEAITDLARIRIIENFLRQLLRRNYNGISPYTRFLLDYFNTNKPFGKGNAEDLIGCSRRTFQRHVKSDIGISPKMFQRIIRFNKAYYLMKNSTAVCMQDISFTCGYYDLSHFVNEFQEFTGASPFQYFLDENRFNALFAGLSHKINT